MKINYTTYGSGKKKILFDIEMLDYYKLEFEEINKNNDYTFFFLQRNQITSLFQHDIFNRVSYKKLNKIYKKCPILKNYYDSLLKICLDNNITHIVFTSTGQYRHPFFLHKLKNNNITIALHTADDDSNSIKYCSLPYTKYYDYHFHAGVMYDTKITIADKFKEFGSKNPIWIPLGARADHINKDIDFENRDIELCYIGNMNPAKFFRISKLKRHFGNRLKLYGGQGNGDRKSLKGIFYKICNKLFGLGYIEKISDEKLLEIYKRTKIGFNLHLVPWKGPSNSRMYELPANGVMQLCDNHVGLARIFKIGKEVVCYKNIKDAIQKIEYYLENDEERIKIAKDGYKRTIDNYTNTMTLKLLINKLIQ